MSREKEQGAHLKLEIERRILHGLALEWEIALHIVSPPIRSLMQRPTFGLDDIKGKWGTWSRERREISLNRELVFNHTWDSVREVLLHEIAHQYADEVLCAYNEPPHGPKFLLACRILRANPKASGEYPPLDGLVAGRALRTEDKLLLRIKKLLALAESKNLHEAEAAMAKAHQLMEKYNLMLITGNEQRDFISIFLGRPALRYSRPHYIIASILQDFYYVRCIWVSAYVIENDKVGRVLEVSGTLQNTVIAHYVYDYVWGFIEREWTAYNKKRGLSRSKKIDFSIGIMEGLLAKLKASIKAEKVKGERPGSLIKIEDPLLTEYFRYRHPRTTSITKQVCFLDEGVLNDGRALGKKMVISQGITEKGEAHDLLIGHQQ